MSENVDVVAGHGRSSDPLFQIKKHLIDRGLWGRFVVHGGRETFIRRNSRGRITGRSTVIFAGRGNGRTAADLREEICTLRRWQANQG